MLQPCEFIFADECVFVRLLEAKYIRGACRMNVNKINLKLVYAFPLLLWSLPSAQVCRKRRKHLFLSSVLTILLKSSLFTDYRSRIVPYLANWDAIALLTSVQTSSLWVVLTRRHAVQPPFPGRASLCRMLRRFSLASCTGRAADCGVFLDGWLTCVSLQCSHVAPLWFLLG